MVSGRHRPARGRINVTSASTEEIIGSVPEGTGLDVEHAVQAASRAFHNGWSQTTPAERADWLNRLAAALKQRGEQIATTHQQ